MKRPAFQFYPADWRNNANLRRCTWGAKGVWIEVMGLLHDSDEYGALRWKLTEIAQAVGCPPTLVRELAEKGVLKGSDKQLEQAYTFAPYHAGRRGQAVTLVDIQPGPLWYSSRMVRDEYKRTNRGISTRFGIPSRSPNGAPDPTPNHSPTRRLGEPPGDPPTRREGDGASASASTSTGMLSEHRDRARDPVDNHGPQMAQNGEPPKPPPGWRKDSTAAARYGEALGIRAGKGEQLEAYVSRIEAELAKRRTGRHAH